MHGEWAIAFAATKAMVLFTYPHWTREYSEYEKFIMGQFTTFVDISQHIRLILLNHAIQL